MNKTLIEWVKNPDGTQGYTWNPVTGCLNGCDYCYARKLANGRLKNLYLANKEVAVTGFDMVYIDGKDPKFTDPFYPRFWPERIAGFFRESKKAKGVFVCDMGELFGDWIPQKWQDMVFTTIRSYAQHRFYLLTKQPQNLAQWSPFPDNCWVGVTATDNVMFHEARHRLEGIQAGLLYLSLEPLLERIKIDWTVFLGGVKWLIIGACTGTRAEMVHLSFITRGRPDYSSIIPFGNKWTLQPKIEWVTEIVEAADRAGIPVFLKDNLLPLIPQRIKNIAAVDSWLIGKPCGVLRQEMPE